MARGYCLVWIMDISACLMPHLCIRHMIQISLNLIQGIRLGQLFHYTHLLTHSSLSPSSNFVRSQVLFANTLFKAVCYHPDEIQIITGGTDRKIGYWELYDGSQIRELDGSQSGSINGMDIHGERFVTGSSDKLIKLWLYNDGDVTHIGEWQ